MADAGALAARAARGAAATWRALGFEQKVAAVGALLLVVSTFGPFSFVEAAQVLVALALLGLLRARAQGRRFHLPFGDGSVVLAAGAWAGVLIAVRLFDRPLGQNLLALACAAIIAVAGLAERRRRPPDDLRQVVRPTPDDLPGERTASEPREASAPPASPNRTATAAPPRVEPPRAGRPDTPPS